MDAANLPPDISAISNLSQESAYVKQVGKDIPELRAMVLRETACAAGARAGLIAQANVIRKEIDTRHVAQLDSFAFGALMLSDGLYPPVISKVTNSVAQDGPDMIRMSNIRYRVERTERFSLAPITWHEYVYQGLPAPDAKVPTPHFTLLPTTPAEKAYWKKSAEDCYVKGIAQADQIVQVNLSRLHRDFMGMGEYKTLALQNKVVPPKVDYTFRPVVGGGNEMIENDHAYRISSPGLLNSNRSDWK
jgi:defect-in-organelle-trafficking protein DotC